MNKKIIFPLLFFTITIAFIVSFIAYSHFKNTYSTIQNDNVVSTQSKTNTTHSSINTKQSSDHNESKSDDTSVTTKQYTNHYEVKSDNNTVTPKQYPKIKEEKSDNITNSAISMNDAHTVSSKKSYSKNNLNLSDYIISQQTISYTLNQGETLSSIARSYENYCNPNSCVKLITLMNNFSSPDELEIGTKILIPENAIKTGTLYRVVSGDTWYSVSEKYYPDYNPESIMKFLVTINNLPNNDLPLGENIFIPKV